MKRFSLLRLGVLIGVMACMAPLVSRADDYDKKTVVTISTPTEVPGIVLQPGTYVIKLLNSSSSRHIAEIMNERMDHLYALTFTVPAERIERTDKPVLTFYEETSGRPQALHKWFWPGETSGQEFLYPKDQAAKIAAATKQRVAEGGLPTVAESAQTLIPDNSNGLSDTKSATVASLEARPASENAETVVVRATEPEITATPVVIAQAVPAPQPQQVAPPVVPASPAPQEPLVADAGASTPTSLPQTASHLPLIGAVGILSLILAAVVAFIRRNRSLSSL